MFIDYVCSIDIDINTRYNQTLKNRMIKCNYMFRCCVSIEYDMRLTLRHVSSKKLLC